MIKIFIKIALSTGAILGMHFLEINKENPPLAKQSSAKLERITTMNGIGDIELFEKMNKCSFEFTMDPKENKFYKAKEFLEKISEDEREK